MMTNNKINMEMLEKEAWIADEAIERISEQQNINGTLLDIGAHVGSFSLYAALYKKATKVIALEPNHSSFTSLVHNIINNNLWGTITPLPLAVIGSGKIFDTKTLYKDPHEDANSGQFSLYYLNVPTGFTVATVPFSTIIELTKPKYIKIDIEGGEWDLFNTGENLKHVQTIEIELHPYSINGIQGKDTITPYLKEKGFKITRWPTKRNHLLGLLCERK